MYIITLTITFNIMYTLYNTIQCIFEINESIIIEDLRMLSDCRIFQHLFGRNVLGYFRTNNICLEKVRENCRTNI